MNLTTFLNEAKPAIESLHVGNKIDIVQSRDSVLSRYRPIFSTANIAKLSADDFYGFLLFENNHHWTGLNRQGPKIIADMPQLRTALKILLDENKGLGNRLDESLSMISGMGKAIATAVLHVAYPEKYGVWNNTSEAGLRKYGLFPEFERGETVGQKYEKINEVLHEVSSATGLDLWTVDGIWWSKTDLKLVEATGGPLPRIDSSDQLFGLERHLHDFLRDNWDKTTLGKEWDINPKKGNDVLDGYEYSTEIGRIDLLAKHKKKPEWLVIELKRDQSADVTLGQVLRYIGYVKEHVAENGEQVRGLIISHVQDKKLEYALSVIPSVSQLLYEVEFRLREPEKRI